MRARLSQPSSVNVLLSDADWAWPQAVSELFRPRGINALMADSAGELVRIVANNKIHLAILDNSPGELSGLHAIKLIRNHDRLVPCILLAGEVDTRLLAQALALDVFSVLAKPIELPILAGYLDRIFRKYYASDLFAALNDSGQGPANTTPTVKKKISMVIKWTTKKDERSNEKDEN